jgi:uncharacterized protein YbaR (Trm112 family)
LWYRPTKLRWWEKFLKILLILPFISKIGKTEIDHGILENSFSIKQWKQALEIFPYVETLTEPYPLGIKSKLNKIGQNWNNINIFTQIMIFFLGGGIKGLAQKHKNMNQNKLQSNLLPNIICVNCRLKNKLHFNKSILQKKSETYYCPKCKNSYPISNKIPLILSKRIFKSLYPNI